MPGLRFENHRPITRVHDRQLFPRPTPYDPGGMRAAARALLQVQPLHALTVPGELLAQNINALGEVPDSTWFENRIGVRDVSALEIARGPGAGGPDRSAPLRIRSSKGLGTAPGFIVEDARGDRYLLKFDPTAPETETGAEVVVQRLLWAAGYHVPDNNVIFFQRDELVVAEGAEMKLAFGESRPLSARDVDAMLVQAPRAPDGRFRALASKFLPGEPVGGYPMTGVRADDPNDRVPHQHRRDVRGQRVFFAWLSHTDVKEKNTLDMWMEQPEGSGRGYLMHYLLDFGKALGVWGRDGKRENDGYAPHFDYGYALSSLLTLGLIERPWEGVRAPALRGVGRYEAEHFDPAIYSPANPYAPFLYTDRFDAFWAAKIIARFDRERIAAAVEAARYSDPRARRYLIETILARRYKTLHYWFSKVAPLDDYRVEESAERRLGLCARDLALQHRVSGRAATRYRLQAYDDAARALGEPRVRTGSPDGELCVRDLPLGGGASSYTLVRLEVFRRERRLPPVIVHIARDPRSNQLRVVGIDRR